MLKESGCGKSSHPLFVWMKGADFGKHPRERFYVVQRRAASCEIETGNFLVFYQNKTPLSLEVYYIINVTF